MIDHYDVDERRNSYYCKRRNSNEEKQPAEQRKQRRLGCVATRLSLLRAQADERFCVVVRLRFHLPAREPDRAGAQAHTDADNADEHCIGRAEYVHVRLRTLEGSDLEDLRQVECETFTVTSNRSAIIGSHSNSQAARQLTSPVNCEVGVLVNGG